VEPREIQFGYRAVTDKTENLRSIAENFERKQLDGQLSAIVAATRFRFYTIYSHT